MVTRLRKSSSSSRLVSCSKLHLSCCLQLNKTVNQDGWKLYTKNILFFCWLQTNKVTADILDYLSMSQLCLKMLGNFVYLRWENINSSWQNFAFQSRYQSNGHHLFLPDINKFSSVGDIFSFPTKTSSTSYWSLPPSYWNFYFIL